MAIRSGCCVNARTQNDVYAIWRTVQDRPLTSSALSKLKYAQKVKKYVYCIITCIWQTIVTFGSRWELSNLTKNPIMYENRHRRVSNLLVCVWKNNPNHHLPATDVGVLSGELTQVHVYKSMYEVSTQKISVLIVWILKREIVHVRA